MDVKVYRDFRLWFIVFTVWCIAFAAVLGVDVFNPQLYRESFRFVVPFTFLVVSSSLYYPENLGRPIKYICASLAVLGLLFLLFTMFIHLHPYDTLLWRRPAGGPPVYRGPFASHQSTGGFYAALTMLQLGAFLNENGRGIKAALLAGALSSSICLLYAASRSFSLGVLSVAGIMLLSLCAGYLRGKTKPDRLKIFLLAAVALISLGAVLRVEMPESEEESGIRTKNVVARLELWKMAVKDFKRSPFIGIGPSRFDDNPEVARTLPQEKGEMKNIYSSVLSQNKKSRYLDVPFFGVDISPFTLHSGRHAHSVYLNVLAEGGVLLFAVFILMYFKLARRLWEFRKKESGGERGLAQGSLCAIACVSIASFFTAGLLVVTPMVTIFCVAGYLLRPGRPVTGG
ncbi:MAG: O-antigen ligase family protein [Deltaproteobacteria bacterium]|nr:O-antigen ligase family protein [Deltaproteobacteria bacterium]